MRYRVLRSRLYLFDATTEDTASRYSNFYFFVNVPTSSSSPSTLAHGVVVTVREVVGTSQQNCCVWVQMSRVYYCDVLPDLPFPRVSAQVPHDHELRLSLVVVRQPDQLLL